MSDRIGFDRYNAITKVVGNRRVGRAEGIRILFNLTHSLAEDVIDILSMIHHKHNSLKRRVDELEQELSTLRDEVYK